MQHNTMALIVTFYDKFGDAIHKREKRQRHEYVQLLGTPTTPIIISRLCCVCMPHSRSSQFQSHLYFGCFIILLVTFEVISHK